MNPKDYIDTAALTQKWIDFTSYATNQADLAFTATKTTLYPLYQSAIEYAPQAAALVAGANIAEAVVHLKNKQVPSLYKLTITALLGHLASQSKSNSTVVCTLATTGFFAQIGYTWFANRRAAKATATATTNTHDPETAKNLAALENRVKQLELNLQSVQIAQKSQAQAQATAVIAFQALASSPTPARPVDDGKGLVSRTPPKPVRASFIRDEEPGEALVREESPARQSASAAAAASPAKVATPAPSPADPTTKGSSLKSRKSGAGDSAADAVITPQRSSGKNREGKVA